MQHVICLIIYILPVNQHTMPDAAHHYRDVRSTKTVQVRPQQLTYYRVDLNLTSDKAYRVFGSLSSETIEVITE